MSIENERLPAKTRHTSGDLSVEALTARYVVLNACEILDGLADDIRAHVALLLARDLLLIAGAAVGDRELAGASQAVQDVLDRHPARPTETGAG